MSTSMSRRTLLQGALAAGALGALSLSGCSTSTAKSSSQPSSSVAGGVAYTMWMWGKGFPDQMLARPKQSLPAITVNQTPIGGDMKQKLLAAFQSKQDVPGITGIKGEWMAYFTSQADKFEDLNALGAKDHVKDYLPWKIQQGSTSDGKLLGWPIDIGPTVLYYRKDIFEAAGLPGEPEALAPKIRTWDDYFALGKELHGKKSDTFLVRNASGIFDTAWKQTGKGFIDENHTFIGDQDHIRQAWNVAVQAFTSGCDAAMESDNQDTTAAVAAGRLPADIGASWHLSDLEDDAPDTKGNWRVVQHPGKPTNNGGSFLTIPKGTPQPEKAFEYIRTLLDVDGQTLMYQTKHNFPSTPGSFNSAPVKEKVDFLGGQVAGDEFGKAANDVVNFFEDPYNATVVAPYYSELQKVEHEKKSSDAAWKDAVDAAKRLAQQNGVKTK